MLNSRLLAKFSTVAISKKIIN